MLTAADGPLLNVFAAVVRRASFSGAASELKLSKSVVSERIKLLEDRCGVRLLERTTRRVRLTDAGAQVLAAATRVEDALGQLSRGLDLARREPAGLLRIATTSDLGPALVGPVVARFVATHAKVRVEVLAEDTQRDMLAARIDLAVRLGAPKTSSLIVRKLAVLSEPIVAAPSLADSLGRVVRPRDLAGAPWVRHSLVSTATMRFLGPGGAKEELAPIVRAEADAGATVLALLLHGAGVGVLPEHMLREPMQDGRLVRLCPGWIWKRVNLYALMPSKPAPGSALKAFLTMLLDEVGRDRIRWTTPDERA